jgi:hypothetical protein
MEFDLMGLSHQYVFCLKTSLTCASLTRVVSDSIDNLQLLISEIIKLQEVIYSV